MTLITNPGHGVTLGGLALMAGGKPVSYAAGFTLEVSRDGTTWSNPDVVVSSLISEFSDGDLVVQQRVGNRQPVLYVRISATTHSGLVAGDSALSAVVGGPEDLIWQPPDPSAPPTVYEVVHSRMDHAWDDWDEMNHRRVWTITMSAMPWPRSVNKIITPAVTAVAPTVVDSGSATTNWTAPGPTGATVTVVSGAVTSTYNPSTVNGNGTYGSALRRTASIGTTTSKYIGIDWKSSLPAVQSVQVNGNPFALETEVRREPLAGGYTRSWYRMADSVTTVNTLELGTQHPANAAASATLSIDQVLLANALPASGTTRQKISTIFPGGSVPAEGTVLVQHPTAGLGQTVVFTHPAGGGYTPPLRQWKVAGAADTADSTLVSGAFTALSPAYEVAVPVNAIPDGDTHLWTRMRRTTAGLVRLSWAAYSTVLATPSALGNSMSGFIDLNFAVANQWYMVPMARFTSPPVKIREAGLLRIGIAGDTLTQIDEGWIFAMDKGVLTVLDNGSGTASATGAANRLRVAAPSLEDPLGDLMVGFEADFSDSHTANASLVACDQVHHRFDPGGSVIFTVTSGTDTAAVSFEHYPRWRSEAGT